MKKRQKRMSILMLLIMLGNFFIGSIIPAVNALSSGVVFNYATEIESKITSVRDKISLSKNNVLYGTNNSYKESVLYLEKELVKLENSLINAKETLDNGLSLKSLIANSYSSKQTIYNTYFINDETIIDVDNITDITYTYYDPSDLLTPIVETLLTKTEIEEGIKNYYLKPIYDEVNIYNTNYDSIISSLQDLYTGVVNLINDKVIDLNNKKATINSFEQTEITLGNSPLMEVNNINIYTLITETITLLEAEKNNITIDNITSKTIAINNIYDDSIGNINAFNINNKTYIENGIDTSISNLETNITTIETTLKGLFIDYNDYKNSNINKYIIDNSLINTIKRIIALEKDYTSLTNNIATYLERKVSDKAVLDALMNTINEKRTYLNEAKVLSDIAKIVDNATLTDEDTVDLLYNFLDISSLDDTIKAKIIAAKLAFYPLTLTDSSNYQIELKDDNLFLINVKTLLTKTDLLNNLAYGNFMKEVIDSSLNVTNNTKVNLYDRNDNLIKTYNVIIKGDINKDNIVNNDDVVSLKEKLLSNEDMLNNISTFDINNDNKVTIEDVILLNNQVNNLTFEGITTTAKLEIKKTTTEELICYNINLITDGNVVGLSFNVKTTDNLIFDSIINPNNLEMNNLTNPSKVISLNNLTDGNILTLCYKEDTTKDLNTETIRLSNIEIVDDAGTLKEITETLLTYIKVVEETKKEETHVVRLNNIENETKENDDSIKKEETPTKGTNDKTEEKQPTEKVLWGNIIKIIIIVLLGATIIYFLNKNETEDDIFEENDEEKKDSK